MSGGARPVRAAAGAARSRSCRTGPRAHEFAPTPASSRELVAALRDLHGLALDASRPRGMRPTTAAAERSRDDARRRAGRARRARAGAARGRGGHGQLAPAASCTSRATTAASRRCRGALGVLRAQGARHRRSRPGTRCPTTASAPTPRSSPSASPRWPASPLGAPQGPDRRPHHRQRHPAARAAARVHPPLAQDRCAAASAST